MKISNEEKIELIIKDLENWAVNDTDRTDGMVYALDNGYHLHAANCWIGTGAMSESIEDKIKGVTINRKKEMSEIKSLIKNADIYICQDCNTHHFIDKGDDPIESCTGCLKSVLIKDKK